METFNTDFDSLDNNVDAFVSPEEADEKKIRTHFSKIDAHPDGRFSKEEYVMYLEAHPNAIEAGENLLEEDGWKLDKLSSLGDIWQLMDECAMWQYSTHLT